MVAKNQNSVAASDGESRRETDLERRFRKAAERGYRPARYERWHLQPNELEIIAREIASERCGRLTPK